LEAWEKVFVELPVVFESTLNNSSSLIEAFEALLVVAVGIAFEASLAMVGKVFEALLVVVRMEFEASLVVAHEAFEAFDVQFAVHHILPYPLAEVNFETRLLYD
jgi:hypothetical protein